jgi:hypothetical protein
VASGGDERMSLIEYPDLEQRSPEWYEARCGIVTASAVGLLISKEQPSPIESACPDCGSSPKQFCVSKSRKDRAPVKTFHGLRVEAAGALPSRLVTANTDTSRGLILTLASERITGRVEETPTSFAMQRGVEEEPFARDEYAKHYGDVVELGFMVRDDWGFRLGYSPDGLVGADGLIEIKSRAPKAQVRTVIEDEIPAANYAQLQCGLLVSGRDWIDYVSFSNGMHLWPRRVLPDQDWFNAITDAAMAAEEAIRDIVTRYDLAAANLPATERIPEIDLELKLA